MGSGRMYEMVRGDGNIWPPRDSVQTTVMANQYSFNFSVFPYVNLISDNLRLYCRLTIFLAFQDRDIALLSFVHFSIVLYIKYLSLKDMLGSMMIADPGIGNLSKLCEILD